MAVLPKVDALIIGLGAVGGVMAKRELATAGMKVVGIDLGPFRRTIDYQYHDELRFSIRKEMLQPKLSERPMMLRPNAQTAAVPFLPWTISTGVGGGSVHFGASTWRILPHHFRIKSDLTARYGDKVLPDGTSIVDWPITYDDLAPYYDKVDTEIGLSGKAGNIKGVIQPGGNPFEGPRSKDFPMPPVLQSTASRMFTTAATAMGYKPFPSPEAILTQSYQGRPGCNYCGFCSSYGCHVGAKSSTLVSVIPVAMASGNLEIRDYCRAIKINSDGTRATSVTYVDQAGAQQEQPASIIVLANYTWEVVRLLLLSGINKNGMVGKYFMAHQYQSITGFFDNPINVSVGPIGANASIDEFDGDNFDHTGLGFIEGGPIKPLGGNTHAIGGVGNVPTGIPAWGADYKAAIKATFNRKVGMLAQLPNLPYTANYLELDPNVKDALGIPVIRITYDGYDNEKKAGTFLQDKMEEIFKKMRATSVKRGPTTIPPATNHEVGGDRMGNDPSTSVVNRYCQSHELPNLFVASGAVCPTYFGYNPTGTIQALAFWTGDYIKNQVKGGGTLAKYM